MNEFKVLNLIDFKNRSAIPAHIFSPLETRDSNFASRTIFQENDTIVE
jgi:hypothetical protein